MFLKERIGIQVIPSVFEIQVKRSCLAAIRTHILQKLQALTELPRTSFKKLLLIVKTKVTRKLTAGHTDYGPT